MDPNDISSEMEPHEAPIPTGVVVLFAIIYNVFGALLMQCFEDWSFLKANYFAFVSMMTIGFGDVIPGQSNINTTLGKVCHF